MSATPESMQELSSQERRALLIRLLKEKEVGRKIYPLSFAQARLWIIDRLLPRDPTYNIPLVLRLPNVLNVDALERSLAEVVRRHESLRTTFVLENGRPMQVVAASPQPTRLNVMDLCSLPRPQRDIEAQRIAAEESAHGFDLAKGPLLRASLLKLDEADYVFVVVMHHIISDAWSIRVLYQELSALYAAYQHGQPSPLPELPLQYGDYAVWQADQFGGEMLQRQLAYWRAQLDGIPALIELPTDRPRPPVQSHRGSLHSLALEPRLSAELSAMGRREDGATLFMMLLAGFNVLLYRYTGQNDIVVGSSTAGRARPEIEGLIGFFANTLVLRTKLSDGMSFRQLLSHVRQITVGAFAHQDMPFERLVEELRPERDLSHNPLFQVAFTLQNLAPAERVAVGAGSSPVPDAPVGVNGTAKFDLTLAMAETRQGIQGVFEYNIDLFDAGTIARMAERFRTLLQSILRYPDRPVSQLPLLNELECSDLIERWRAPADPDDEAPELTLCAAVAAHAKSSPDAIAIGSDANAVCYRDLELRASRLARRLRSSGGTDNARVAVCLEDLTEAMVATLAIWKAGCICVPLEPGEPAARMALLLDDAGAKLVVSEQRLGDRVGSLAARVLYVDGAGEEILQCAGDEADVPLRTEQACLLYESAPDGKPRGVIVTHRALFRTGYGPELKLVPSDVAVLYPGHNGNGAFFDLCALMAAGAHAIGCPARPPVPPRRLAALLRDRRVTLLFAPVAVLERLAREFPWAFETLRLILCDDPPTVLEPLLSVLNPAMRERVYSRYAITEAGGCVALQSLAGQLLPSGEATVGRPAGPATLYLLDSAGAPVPDDLPAEICIATPNLAYGYHGQPARSADLFIPNSYSAAPGTRLYRTGDIARSSSDGSIRLLRRRERRIVASGWRVEPAELEAALAPCPGLREVAVIGREIPGSHAREILALCVSEEGHALSTDHLLIWLRERVPDYMLPSFMLVDALPRNSRGEIDGRAAAELGAARPARPPYVLPRNDIERRIALIWAEIFCLERIGIHDNFFGLGGHSLLATQVVARVCDSFGVDLPLARLFETPTIAELSRAVEQLAAAGKQTKAPPIARRTREAVRLPPGADRRE
jgi:non-ribosomal peptide synthetase component F/acyl carrier protein